MLFLSLGLITIYWIHSTSGNAVTTEFALNALECTRSSMATFSRPCVTHICIAANLKNAMNRYCQMLPTSSSAFAALCIGGENSRTHSCRRRSLQDKVLANSRKLSEAIMTERTGFGITNRFTGADYVGPLASAQ